MLSSEARAKLVQPLIKKFPRLWMERELRYRPNHFEREFWLLPVLCDRQKTSIDVGANTGQFSYFMQKFSRQVIAFEPNAELWPSLRRLLGKDFRIESAALSDKDGTASLRVDSTNTGVSTIEEKNQQVCVRDRSAVAERVVPVRTLDSYSFADVGMIKIDVEGHEEAVVSGAIDTISKNRPFLLIESEDRHNPGAPDRVAKRLSALEYSGMFLKAGRLRDYGELRKEDVNPENLAGGRPYINNFIFIPAERKGVIRELNALADRRGL